MGKTLRLIDRGSKRAADEYVPVPVDGDRVPDFVVVPSECMVGDDYLFLDDLTIKDVERELGVEIVPSGYDARDFVRELVRRGLPG